MRRMSEFQHSHESERVDAVRRYSILDTGRETLYDDISTLAAKMCGTCYAAISFVDERRCWLKSTYGFKSEQYDRDAWFCAQTVTNPDEVTLIPDTRKDKQYSAGNHVKGDLHIRCYAGAPIVSPDGFALGAVCVMDKELRDIGEEQIAALRAFSRQVSSLLELRRTNSLLELAAIKMQMLVDRDSITGLPSERMFRAQLRTEFQYARRHNMPLSVVLIDIDGFVHINENYGTERGDDILKRVARIVNRDTRDYDLVARSGSDEFAIVMRNAGSATGLGVAHRLKARIASMEWSREPITVSIGVSTISPEMISSRDLVERARAALRDFHSNARPAAV
jgi:diguanylate cyclase (GGDEF)-like protein